MKTIFFVRHGQTEWNAIERMQGQWDSDLSPLGRRQADANGRLLAEAGIEAIFASPLSRVRQTVEIIGRHVDVPVRFDDRLMERDCGEWSGHMYGELPERWPEEWAALRADPYHYRGPGCENYPDMRARAEPFLAELAEEPHDTVAVVSHGLIGRVMMALLLDLSEEGTLAIRQPNDVVYRVSPGPNGRELHHFRGIDGPTEGIAGAA